MSKTSYHLALNGGSPIRRNPLALHKPWFGREELAVVAECLDTGKVGGEGPKGRELESHLQQFLGAHRVLLTTSGTSALEMAMMISRISAGDEVILPSFTFVSTANAVVRVEARPVFVDIEARTFNIDPALIEKAVTLRTRAIILVHYAGMACDMERIGDIAKRHRLVVIEDATHAMNAEYQGRPLGTWGSMGCLSFHETKDMVCGEGGALVIRDEETFAHQAEIIREKGTNRSAFLRGDVDKYSWIALGSSYVLSDILAAVALEQFKKIHEITRRKTEHAEFLLEHLTAYENFIHLPVVPDGCKPNWHLFAILVDPSYRDWILRALRAEGIGAAFHFVPLHSAPFAANCSDIQKTVLPVTDRVASSLVRLPLYAEMTREDRVDVVNAVDKVLSAVTTDA